MNKEQFYADNTDICEEAWTEHIFEEYSGHYCEDHIIDVISQNEDNFWEFIEDLMEKNNV